MQKIFSFSSTPLCIDNIAEFFWNIYCFSSNSTITSIKKTNYKFAPQKQQKFTTHLSENVGLFSVMQRKRPVSYCPKI